MDKIPRKAQGPPRLKRIVNHKLNLMGFFRPGHFQLLDELLKYLLGHYVLSMTVLFQQGIIGYFHIDDANPGFVGAT